MGQKQSQPTIQQVKMPEITMAGLLYSLPTTNTYEPPVFVPVPLTSVQVHVRVLNFIAQVELIQVYHNVEKNPIEVIYFFPAEEEAAVISCSAELDGRNIETVIKEKEKAKELYDEAIRDRKTAFLLEETKPDIFQMKVGNLSPGSECKVTINYIMELPVEDGKTKLTIPTTISPRYVPARDGSEAAKKIASIEYDLTTPAALTLQLDIAMKTKMTSVTSPSHQLVTDIHGADKTGSYGAVSRFDGLTADMDRDIVVLIESEEPNQPKVFIEKGADGSIAGLVSLVPRFELKKQPSEVIFLIDCSGSMSGKSIGLAKEALQLFIHSLPVDSFFNVFCFGSSFTQLFPESRAFTDESLDSAKMLLKRLDANLGGTEIFEPLEAIFKCPPLVGKPRQVFVITDGEVSNSQQCVQLVEQHNQHNRVFTLGIGASADRHLVKGMARAGMGTHSFTTYGENIAGKVLKQLKQSLQPCVHDVQVDWGQGAGGAELESCQAPLKTPPVYDGSRLLVYKLWDKAGSVGEKVTITAKTPEGELSLDVKIDKDSFSEGDLIHKLFARKMIQDLEEKFEKNNTEEIKSLITDLGVKYGLASKHTSFIAVDDKSNKETGVMMTRQVRNQVAHGYQALGSQMGPPGACAPMMCIDSAPRMMKCMRMDSAPMSAPGARCGAMLESLELATDFCQEEDEDYCEDGLEESEDGLEEREDVIEESEEELKSNMEKVLALTSLQAAAGYFKQEEIIRTIIGNKFEVFKAECVTKNIDTKVWLTALVIAFIEQNFPDEKDTWDLIVEKARDWLGNTEVVVAASDCLN
eukprot:GFUD01033440.1.p1 GENE.GFUD01033440.1~~GFUD01033440.1.p1  ORF type:complete len:808 (-),score=279.18 GFUD01033440.1:316-2739(-)